MAEDTEFKCRVGITEQRHCVMRQTGDYRWTSSGGLNRKYVSCLRPIACPHWLSDNEWAEAQKTNGRHKKCWEVKIDA
jgi:hypothetical protein